MGGRRIGPKILWIDDNLIIGTKKAGEKTKKDIMERFDCEDVETLKSTWDAR